MHILKLAFVSFGSGSLVKFAVSGFLSYFQRLVKIHLFDIKMGLWITRIIEVSSVYLHYYFPFSKNIIYCVKYHSYFD